MPTPETAGFTPAEAALWSRIAAHSFAYPERALDFVGRLAADMGWTRSTAAQAVEEYRRFCFLAMTGAVPTTPSEEVDAVWHLHLTYSRDYWDVWCGQVLRGPLHHDPTAGGPDEGARFREQYAATLFRYEARFGAPDPAFWPGTRGRFRGAARYRMVDTDRVLVLPRPRLALPWRAAVILAAFAPRPAWALGIDPFDYDGPTFLALYAKVAAAAFLLFLGLTLATRWWVRSAVPDREPGDLSPLELAYVAGGPARAADVVALSLYTSGAAYVGTARGTLHIDAAGVALPPEIQPFLADETGSTTRAAFLRSVKGRLDPMIRSLVARGLAPEPGLRVRLAVLAAAPVAVAIAFGAAKVAVGSARHRPVGYLVAMIALLVAAAVIAHFLQPHLRTRAGDRALADATRRHARAARAPLPLELPLAFALVGMAALVPGDPAHAAYQRYLTAPGTGGGGDGGGSGCGGGGDGGGGGGCGGCGGGGGD